MQRNVCTIRLQYRDFITAGNDLLSSSAKWTKGTALDRPELI
ncbi:hypothetical protein T06_15958 [Trichinella sp. T6]|nr:hypothetical protein T06_15958 [Trichinella sp. T6]